MLKGRKDLPEKKREKGTSLTNNHLKGETLPESQQVFQVKVLTHFLRAGVPLSKLACFCELLEESAFCTSDRRHMSDLIPLVLQEEEAEI